ncbi:hypothetical protein DPMN_088731 [Dreissena polymorpha]|uniref:Uncharacterized protein n=1 Tax=Dreissena polymorpha TaxID=45954 RepID=A0A9D4KV31_DREPO|nr:hypothetical protein DPMN_088731 [Dreissena polymorpha]
MSIWWVWTQLMGTKDTHYHSIRFKGEHSLTGVAKFAKLVTYKKVVGCVGVCTLLSLLYSSAGMRCIQICFNVINTLPAIL